MKDSGSLTDKITNNWVLKRKRRKIPGGSHLINDREQNSTASESLRKRSSPKQSPEDDLSPELSSFKRKGNDGVRHTDFSMIFPCFILLLFLLLLSLFSNLFSA